MENTKRILILYVFMLSLNCLNAEEGATAAKRLLFINTAELTQERYFENTLASKLKSKGMLLWRIDFAFVSTGNVRLWIHSEFKKIRFNQGRPPEKSPVGTDGLDTKFYIQNRFRIAACGDQDSQDTPVRT